MDKLRHDLETLEVERLDVSVTDLADGLEFYSMGHAATELGHSCDAQGCGHSSCPCNCER